MQRRPGIARALLLAAESLFDDLAPMVGGNLVFGACLLVTVLAAQAHLLGNLLIIPLAVPAAGVMRLAAAHVRRGTGHWTDFGDGLRRWRMVLAVAVVQVLAAGLLVLDLALGLSAGGLVGGVLAAMATYGAALAWVAAVTGWPLLMDPEHDAEPMARRLRLALALMLSRPLRLGLLALLVGALLAIATVAIVPVLLFAFALACLLAAHYVLPAADALEGRDSD